MHASAQLRLPDGRRHTLYAGQIIGRAWSAALRLDRPDVSEAHALLSLRGEQLWLLALRRRFTVGGRTVDGAPLAEGLAVDLTPDLSLVVEALALPETVLGLEGRNLPAQALFDPGALVCDPQPRLVPGTPGEALAVFWSSEGRWRGRPAGGEAVALEPGCAFEAGGQVWRAVAIPLGAAGQRSTRSDAPEPLHLVTFYDTVQIHRPSGEVVVLAGQLAQVVSELASVGQPLGWEALAQPRWPHITDRDTLRRRWDGLLGRLRDRLRAEGLRPDLVTSTRVGLVELILRAGDVVDDRA